jgi:hypothetical protein
MSSGGSAFTGIYRSPLTCRLALVGRAEGDGRDEKTDEYEEHRDDYTCRNLSSSPVAAATRSHKRASRADRKDDQQQCDGLTEFTHRRLLVSYRLE